jgi:hypothetical protein
MRLARDPLFHFAIIGAALFAANAWTAKPEAPKDRIVISAGLVENIAQLHERTWKRPPSKDELTALVAARVREEVIYREALTLGLATDDVIVRRRLVQKYDFLTDGLSDAAAPSDGDLAAHLAANADEYRREPSYTFAQVFVREGPGVEARAAAVLAELRAGADPDLAGDPVDLPRGAREADASRIDAAFGRDFAKGLGAAELGIWDGPVKSAYGLHLVKVAAKQPGRLPELAEVRAAVERDWRQAARKRSREALYEQLRARYDVVIELGAGGGA